MIRKVKRKREREERGERQGRMGEKQPIGEGLEETFLQLKLSQHV